MNAAVFYPLLLAVYINLHRKSEFLCSNDFNDK